MQENKSECMKAELDKNIEKGDNKGAFDSVNRPAHYASGKFECIDILKDIFTPEQFEGFCLGNTVKYIWRAGKKDPTKKLEDIKKSRWYLDTLIKTLEPEPEKKQVEKNVFDFAPSDGLSEVTVGGIHLLLDSEGRVRGVEVMEPQTIKHILKGGNNPNESH